MLRGGDPELGLGIVVLANTTRPYDHSALMSAVIADVAIDQGGCVATARPTTHSDPVYTVDGVTHYCVANMPGAVPVTSTKALTNATLPYVEAIANNGLREAIAQGQRQLSALRLNRLSEVATDTQATEAAVAAAEQQLRAAADVLARREVVAPEDGKVTNIRAFTPGASIAPGDPVLDLVPAHDRFVAEAQIQPTDIEQVAVRQRVNVRLSSYRMRALPLVPGRVIQVAADAQTTPNGASFSTITQPVSARMTKRFITPPTNRMSIRAQQQPRQ